jgi:hypothetical protein
MTKPQMNPGCAGPKGALDLPAAKRNEGHVKRDNHDQRNWVRLPKKKRGRRTDKAGS